MTKVLIVDDHELIRTGMKIILEKISGVEVVGSAASGEEAIRLNRELKPDLILMDVNMPGIGGVEAIVRIFKTKPPPKIIVVSSNISDFIPSRLLKMGISGYLTKQADDDVIAEAVTKVMKDESYVDPLIMKKLGATQANGALLLESIKEDGLLVSFNERELQILLMVAKGMNAAEISEKLFLTSKTVNGYRNDIQKKLNVKTDVEAAKIAIEKGLVDVDTDWH